MRRALKSCSDTFYHYNCNFFIIIGWEKIKSWRAVRQKRNMLTIIKVFRNNQIFFHSQVKCFNLCLYFTLRCFKCLCVMPLQCRFPAEKRVLSAHACACGLLSHCSPTEGKVQRLLQLESLSSCFSSFLLPPSVKSPPQWFL